MKKWTVISLIVILLSCQKAQRDEDIKVNTCEDISLVQSIFADAYKQMRIAAMNTEGISSAETTLTSIYGCEEIMADTGVNPRNIIIDYKFIGCEGLGVERYGRLLGDFYGEFVKEGSAVDITFLNYFYREFEVNGKIRVIFKERNAADQEVHTLYVQSGSVYDGSYTATWTANQTWTIETASDKSEIYHIIGNSNGMNRKGNIFKAEITAENIMTEACLYTISGKQKIEVRNLSTRFLDYGSGVCDRTAEAVINGASFTVTIP